MKIYSDFHYIKQAEYVGNMVSMGFFESQRSVHELGLKLREYFKSKKSDYEEYYEEDKTEDILYSINEYIDDKKIDKVHLEFPYSDGTNIYLLPITDNLEVEIMLVDEYYGGGDYNKYIQIGRFKINEHTTENDVDRLIEFIDKYLTI